MRIHRCFTVPGMSILLSLLMIAKCTAAGDQLFPRINATDFSSQNGIRTSGSTIGYFDDSDYITYNDVNFGPFDTTKSIRISYAKGNGDGAKMEVRLDGQAGQLIGEFIPIRTGGWGDYRSTYFNIEDVDDVHNVILVGKGGSGVLNLEWIELPYEQLV